MNGILITCTLIRHQFNQTNRIDVQKCHPMKKKNQNFLQYNRTNNRDGLGCLRINLLMRWSGDHWFGSKGSLFLSLNQHSGDCGCSFCCCRHRRFSNVFCLLNVAFHRKPMQSDRFEWPQLCNSNVYGQVAIWQNHFIFFLFNQN